MSAPVLGPGITHRFEALRTSAADPAIVSWLHATATTGSDFDCYQINPFHVAEQVGVSRLDAVRSFLFATRLGVTDLTWDIHCPSCAGQPQYHRHLMQLVERAHCPLCDLRWDLSLEDQLAVSFTVNPDVRRVDIDNFCEREWPAARDRLFARLAREGRFPALASPIARGETLIGPTGTLEPGAHDVAVPGHTDGAATLIVDGDPTDEVQDLRVHCDEHGVEIQQAFAAVDAPLDAITIKIGVHRGPTIAVTSNRALDYFGRTVNLAARLQGASRPGEVLLSEAVLDDPEVRAALAARGLVTVWQDVALKGITGEVRAAAVRPA